MKAKCQNQNKVNKLYSEAGITMLTLLVTIIILVVLTAVAVKIIAGDNGIIGVASDSGVDHEVKAYWEQITRNVQGEIISKATVNEVATADTIITALNEEDWVRLAKKGAESTDEVVCITVQVVDGYIYQIYYNVDYGKIQIDYVGKDIPEDNWDDMTLIARYEIANASIYATAEDKKNGVAKLELIYKDQIVGSIDNPKGEQSWKVNKISPGWYKIRATSNSGMIKTTWVKARNFSDSLSMPSIEIETESAEHNGWYGADGKDVFIKISTDSPSAKEIHYVLTGTQIKGETTDSLPDGTGIRSIRFQITETGTTTIKAWTEDGNGYQSEENMAEVKFDNVKPEVTGNEIKGTEGQNSWYISDVEIVVNANDPKGVLDGYKYTVLSSTGAVLTPETHVKNAEQTIKNELNLAKDGIYIVVIQAIVQAGNKSPSKTLTIQKDTENPTIGEPQIANIVENGFRVSVSAGDITSGIDRYEYYFNGSLAHTSQDAVWEASNLTPNTYYNVTVRVYDRAGLMKESISAPITTKGELLAPEVQISGQTRNGYYIGDVTIQVRDTSDNTKTRLNRIKVTGGSAEQIINGTSGSFTITTDGTYTISAVSIDAQNNESTPTTKPAFTRDATPPSKASLTLGTVAEKTISVTASGADATSGIASYKFEYKLSTVSNWNTATTKSTTSTSCSYTYEGLIGGNTYNLRVTVTDKAGNTYTGNSIKGITKTNDIGKYVNYKPTSGNYTASSSYSGYSSDQSFTTETSLRWRIWNIDSSNIYLISDKTTSTILYLKGVLGYNNGVTLLDNICNSCYKNSSYSGMIARNLKVEDVTAIVAVSNSLITDYGTQPYTYTFATPYIWATYEKSSKTNAISNRSTGYSLTTNTTSSSTSVKPYLIVWHNSYMNTISAYKNAKYKELVTDPVSTQNYWLSSRYVYPNTGTSCNFGLQKMQSTDMNFDCLYSCSRSSANEHSYSNAIRPLVTIPLNSCTLKESSTPGIDYDITAK